MGGKEQLQQISQQAQREKGQNKETVGMWEQTKSGKGEYKQENKADITVTDL